MDNIDQLNDYSKFVGFVNERNRPSGGIKTIHKVAVASFLDSTKKILEIGSNTGFTSVNLALMTGCEVVGVDTNDSSIKNAELYAAEQGVETRVKFVNANACELPFPDSSFDLVWCSNVTSFISDKEKAISEYLRVLKPGGVLVVVPIYYITTPPQDVVKRVSSAIGSDITVRDKEGWKKIFFETAVSSGNALELFFEEDFIYHDVSGGIPDYVDMLMSKDNIKSLDSDKRNKVREMAEYFYGLFNENLRYAGYSIILYQKRNALDELELFVSKKKYE